MQKLAVLTRLVLVRGGIPDPTVFVGQNNGRSAEVRRQVITLNVLTVKLHDPLEQDCTSLTSLNKITMNAEQLVDSFIKERTNLEAARSAVQDADGHVSQAKREAERLGSQVGRIRHDLKRAINLSFEQKAEMEGQLSELEPQHAAASRALEAALRKQVESEATLKTLVEKSSVGLETVKALQILLNDCHSETERLQALITEQQGKVAAAVALIDRSQVATLKTRQQDLLAEQLIGVDRAAELAALEADIEDADRALLEIEKEAVRVAREATNAIAGLERLQSAVQARISNLNGAVSYCLRQYFVGQVIREVTAFEGLREELMASIARLQAIETIIQNQGIPQEFFAGRQGGATQFRVLEGYLSLPHLIGEFTKNSPAAAPYKLEMMAGLVQTALARELATLEENGISFLAQ